MYPTHHKLPQAMCSKRQVRNGSIFNHDVRPVRGPSPANPNPLCLISHRGICIRAEQTYTCACLHVVFMFVWVVPLLRALMG